VKGSSEEKRPVLAMRSEMAFSGPLPPPEMLSAYERALPTSAERILKMAELEQAHMHSLERSDMDARTRIAQRGQVLAFTLGMSGTVGGIVLSFFDKSIAGFGVFFTSLATLAGVYFHGQKQAKQQTSELPEKKK
jgi:uncharacterized membrane protein